MDGVRNSQEDPDLRRSTVLEDFGAARGEVSVPVGRTSDPPPERSAGRRSALRVLAIGVVLGFLATAVGLGLGIWSYDKRFIYDDPRPVWESVSWVGVFMFLAGFVLIVVSILGILVVALIRLLRRALGRT